MSHKEDEFFLKGQREEQQHFYSSRQERLSIFPTIKRSNSVQQRKKIRKLLLVDMLLLLVALVVGMSMLRKPHNSGLLDLEAELHALNIEDNCKVILRLLPKSQPSARETLQWRVELNGQTQQKQVKIDSQEAQDWELNFPYQASGQIVRSWLKLGEQELQLHAVVR